MDVINAFHAFHRSLELSPHELDPLATLPALQAHIQAQLVDSPAPTTAWVRLFEGYHLPDLPSITRARHSHP